MLLSDWLSHALHTIIVCSGLVYSTEIATFPYFFEVLNVTKQMNKKFL